MISNYYVDLAEGTTHNIHMHIIILYNLTILPTYVFGISMYIIPE